MCVWVGGWVGVLVCARAIHAWAGERFIIRQVRARVRAYVRVFVRSFVRACVREAALVPSPRRGPTLGAPPPPPPPHIYR